MVLEATMIWCVPLPLISLPSSRALWRTCSLVKKCSTSRAAPANASDTLDLFLTTFPSLSVYERSLDNSEWMRNGDYIPSRLEAQHDAANLLCGTKTQSNPESTVGVLTMAGKRCARVCCSLKGDARELTLYVYMALGAAPASKCWHRRRRTWGRC